MQGMRSGQRESLAGLRIVLQALQFGLRKSQRLPCEQRGLPSLIVNELLTIYRETHCDLAIQEVRLGEAKHNIFL